MRHSQAANEAITDPNESVLGAQGNLSALCSLLLENEQIDETWQRCLKEPLVLRCLVEED
jgi:hypothetical protein